jgi:hypothetical protein
MAVKLKDLKLLPPDHRIFKIAFFTVSHNTSGRKPEEPNQRISKNPPYPRKKAGKINTSFPKKADKK